MLGYLSAFQSSSSSWAGEKVRAMRTSGSFVAAGSGLRRAVDQDFAVDSLLERAFRLDLVLAVLAAKRSARRAGRQRTLDHMLAVREDHDGLLAGARGLRASLDGKVLL